MLQTNRFQTTRHRTWPGAKRRSGVTDDEEALASTRWQRRGLLAFAGLLLLLAAMVAGYLLTLCSVYVEVDGRTLHLRTHLTTLGEALAEARISLQPEDRVEPPLDTPVYSGLYVEILRARTVHITVDGDSRLHRTLAVTVGDALTEAGVRWIPEDRITIADRVVLGGQPLYGHVAPSRQASSRGGARPTALEVESEPVHVVVQRAVPIAVQDGQTPYTFLTTARTLGEALLDKSITLYAADKIDLPLDTPIQAGLSVTIDRSRPVTLLADGQIRQTRTRAATVADLLAEEGVTLEELDYTRPALDDPIVADARIMVVRVHESEIVEEESIPFQYERRPNPNLELDQEQVDHWGAPGIFRRSLRVRYENGIEVSRTLDREWVEKPPQNRVVSYGTKIVQRQLETPEGTFTYWRKVRVLATSYTAATCGKARSDPAYGITRVGWKARKGIVAVDPNVIPLFTEMYVPGYGPGTAADTGGMIKGLRIDLCYDEDQLVHWWKWVDVYLLGPPPPPRQIRYTLPDYPRER
jgi:uncharacterized protein YabE (DUF348 family)